MNYRFRSTGDESGESGEWQINSLSIRDEIHQQISSCIPRIQAEFKLAGHLIE